MNLRTARFDDDWKKVFSRVYLTRLERLSYSGIRCLCDDMIVYANGITAIVGGNGVGKSTLAQATVDVLANQDGSKKFYSKSDRLSGSELLARLSKESTITERKVTFDQNGSIQPNIDSSGSDATWLDPSDMALQCQQQISGDPAFMELLDSFGPKVMNEDEISIASMVIGKKYTKCVTWEILDYGNFTVMPYFEVYCNEAKYGSENMGRGELALMITLWFLSRSTKNSILVLEEPENHISARSQDALMNIVARTCATKGLWIIITTHSAAIIRRLPKENIRLLTNAGGKSVLMPSPHSYQIANILGGGITYSKLLLTEDQCGKEFALALCEAIDPDLRRQISVVSVSGDSKIDVILRSLTKPDKWASTIVGVYDGDTRQQKKEGMQWPHAYLPGDVAPEIMLRRCLDDEENIKQLAEHLKCDINNIHVALDVATGLDHHDWHERFAQSLGPNKSTVTRALSHVWALANPTEARQFIEDLQCAFG